jgi:hypothetical protein
MFHAVRDGVAMPPQTFRLHPLVQNGESTSGTDRHRSIAKLPQLILIVDGAVDYYDGTCSQTAIRNALLRHRQSGNKKAPRAFGNSRLCGMTSGVGAIPPFHPAAKPPRKPGATIFMQGRLEEISFPRLNSAA